MVESSEPRRQLEIIDVVHWEADAEFGVFPQGARAKEAVFAPEQRNYECIVPSKRYLFKRSKGAYPDQFWGEVVAYRIGCLMGLQVPPAFAAFNSGTGHSAALIEWFYDDIGERFVHAGDYFQRLVPEFDRSKGQQHNLTDAKIMLRAFAQGSLRENWRQWVADMLTFDCLIGNTDRHQDNWGFVYFIDPTDSEAYARLAPLFDNGTSLGHEMFIDRIAAWRSENVERYISRGRHHMGMTRATGRSSCGHIAMVENVLTEWPDTCEDVKARLDCLDERLPALFDELAALGGPVPLTAERARFMLKLLLRRLELLHVITS